MIPSFSPQKSLSHALIVVCIAISLLGFINPVFRMTFSFHSNALSYDILTLLSQGALFQFLHWGVLHLVMNIYFLYLAGPEVEARMSRDQFLWFFLLNTLLIIAWLLFFASPNTMTLGISGFCTALLSYIWIDLRSLRHHQANYFGMMLGLNVAIGLFSGISFVGHFFGALGGIAWWYVTKKMK